MNLVAADVSRRTCLLSRQRIAPTYVGGYGLGVQCANFPRCVGEQCAIAKSPARGDRIAVQEDFLSPIRGSDFHYYNPTADAVGYRCSAAIYRSSKKLIPAHVIHARKFSLAYPPQPVNSLRSLTTL